MKTEAEIALNAEAEIRTQELIAARRENVSLRNDIADARAAARWLGERVRDLDACTEACDRWPWLEQENKRTGQ